MASRSSSRDGVPTPRPTTRLMSPRSTAQRATSDKDPSVLDDGLEGVAGQSGHGIHAGGPDGRLVLFHPAGELRQFLIHAVLVVRVFRLVGPCWAVPMGSRPPSGG